MSDYQQSLMLAFAKVLKAEQAKARADSEMQAAKLSQAEAGAAVEKAWAEVKAVMDGQGVVEERLPGDATDYLLYYPPPARKVSIPDDRAVPEQFLKTEPKKKDIADHLRALEKSGQPLPNWAGWEAGESKLTWKPVKRQA